MPNGMYFQSFLNEISNRRQVEAHEFATQQMINQNVFQTISNGIQGIGQQIHDQKAKENQFQYEAEATGLFDPKLYQVKTDTENKFESQLAEEQGKTDALKEQMADIMKQSSQPIGVNKQQPPELGPENQTGFNPMDTTSLEQRQRLSNNDRLDALQKSYSEQSARSDQVALGLQQYKNSDQYANDLKSGAWKNFVGNDYNLRYLQTHDAYQNMLYMQKLEEENAVKNKYSGGGSSGRIIENEFLDERDKVSKHLSDIAMDIRAKNPLIQGNSTQLDAFNKTYDDLNKEIANAPNKEALTKIRLKIDSNLRDFYNYMKSQPKQNPKGFKKQEQLSEEDKKIQALADQFKK